MTTTLEDRIAGVLIGQAAGDALGAPYEFQSVVKPQDAVMAPGGLGHWELGEWTDDTQQAILVAQAKANPRKLAESLISWYEGGPPDVGGTTAASLSAGLRARLDEKSSLTVYGRLLQAAERVNGSSNGSLMRTAPVALTQLGHPGRAAEAAALVSKLTHAHPQAVEATMIWTVLVERAVREGGQTETGHVQDTITHIPKASWPFWEERVEWALSSETWREREGFSNMPAAVALEQALSAIWHTPGQELEGALRLAVSYGGDTDTVAAIAGSLLGAMHGACSVPGEWVKVLHGQVLPGEYMNAEGLHALALATVPEGALS